MSVTVQPKAASHEAPYQTADTGSSHPDTAHLAPVPRISVQAFCLSDHSARTVEAAAEDRRMAKAHTKVHLGGIAAAVEYFSQAPTPNLIIVEVAASNGNVLSELDNLAEYCDAGTKVIVLGDLNDVKLYRELMQAGVSDYLVSPVDIYQLIGSISGLYADPDAEPLGRAIAFFGVKGGCGSSTVAHNTGWSIGRQFQHDVVVADLDLPFGTAGLDFNQDPIQGVFEAISAPDRLDQTLLDRILAKCSEHLSLLAAPATLDKTYDQGEGAYEILVDVMRAAAPSIVLDVPHVWNGWTKNVLMTSDEVVVVAEPDLANLRNAKNVVDVLAQLRPNDRAPRLVINRVNVPKRPEIKPEEFANALGLDLVCQIPFEPQLFGTAANNGQMICEVDAKHAISETFSDLANTVLGKVNPTKSKRSGLGALMAKLGR